MTNETTAAPKQGSKPADGKSELNGGLGKAFKTTVCWNCNAEYDTTAEICQKCCATNANIDIETAQIEMKKPELIKHNWEFQDDSFSHEYGTEQIHYWQCTRCGQNAPMDDMKG